MKNNRWVYLDEENQGNKISYIFRDNNVLLISLNGNVKKAEWENFSDSSKSLILNIDNSTKLFNILYLSSEFFVIQKDGTDSFEVFVKELDPSLSSRQIEDYHKFILSKLGYPLADNEHNLEDDGAINLSDSGKSPIESEINSRPVIVEDDDTTNFYFSKLSVHEEEITLDLNDLERFYRSSGNYKYYDIPFIIKELENIRLISNKEQEVDIIIDLQKKEENMIFDGILCPFCHAINSIQDTICIACNYEIPELQETIDTIAESVEKENLTLYHSFIPSEEKEITLNLDDIELFYRTSGNYKYYDIPFIIEGLVSNHRIKNKEQEATIIIELQNIEERMIEEGILCPDCKALFSIKGQNCVLCNIK